MTIKWVSKRQWVRSFLDLKRVHQRTVTELEKANDRNAQLEVQHLLDVAEIDYLTARKR